MDFTPNPPVQEWFRKNSGILIRCPHQPGDLKISPNACRQRYKVGKEMTIREEEASIIRRDFEICRRCPIGENLLGEN